MSVKNIFQRLGLAANFSCQFLLRPMCCSDPGSFGMKTGSNLHNYLSNFSQVLQFVRRLALSVPQPAHLMYIARANQLVIRALHPRMATNTRIFSATSFKASPISTSSTAAFRSRRYSAREKSFITFIASVRIEGNHRGQVLYYAAAM